MGVAERPEIALTNADRSATFHVPIRGVGADALAKSKFDVTVVDGPRAAETVIKPRLAPVPPIPDQTLRGSIVGVALVGGLVLNLMPCVLPVLSLKLLALVGHAGAERRTARLGLIATAGGVTASFDVFAVGLIALKAAGATIGWGIQFQ